MACILFNSQGQYKWLRTYELIQSIELIEMISNHSIFFLLNNGQKRVSRRFKPATCLSPKQAIKCWQESNKLTNLMVV